MLLQIVILRERAGPENKVQWGQRVQFRNVELEEYVVTSIQGRKYLKRDQDLVKRN